ncbi:NIL domain-containing protein [Desulfopila inferna]|uniref:NIL domain-containing protein n=1 Tax=Desulfopila inferna TaxID=468528 RepID=UPI0019644ED2|nr:NIL domain-containing protein [Desulfopila inferna]MBM9605086.1 4Fe-4S binding protein [Desulfopila inferna]
MYARIYILRFPKDTSDKPFIYNLVKKFDVESNILKADIFPHREGMMVLELRGVRNNVKEAIQYLKSFEVRVERLAAGISRDEQKCFQCGACTGICPSGALFMRRSDMAVIFDPEKCTGCSLCVTICPVRAMDVCLGEEQYPVKS